MMVAINIRIFITGDNFRHLFAMVYLEFQTELPENKQVIEDSDCSN